MQPPVSHILHYVDRIHHIDLYRLSGNPDDLIPLNLNHVFQNCLSLVEWPSRMEEYPSQRLDVHITIPTESTSHNQDEEDGRRIVRMTSYGTRWETLLHRIISEGLLDDLLLASDEPQK